MVVSANIKNTVKEPAPLAPAAKIVPALVHHYSPAKAGDMATDSKHLIDLLLKLPSLSHEDHAESVSVQLRKHGSGMSFTEHDMAIVSFVDEATTEVLLQTDLDFKIESFIRDIAPRLTALVLESDIHAVTKKHKLFSLMDLIIIECIGWSEDLGFLGQQYIEKVELVTSGFSSGRLTVEACIKDLKAVFKKEQPLFLKQERLLCDRELKVLSGMKGKYFSALLLNKQMVGQQLPLFVIFMLQGPWYEFVQQLYVHYGQDSKEWGNAQKITEAMVWSLQPDRDESKQSQIMKTVPDHIKSLCENVPFDAAQMVSALADLEAEYDAIRSGEASDPCDFELLETDQSMAAASGKTTAQAIKKIKSIQVGQWFLYDDPAEPDEKVARIKLILNWTETDQLLLTNHNRRKVVHMSYGELANHLSSGILKKLNPMHSAAETFKAHLAKVLKAVSQQNKKEKKIAVQQERSVVSEAYSSQRKEDLEKQLAILEKRAERKKQRAMVLRHKAQKKYAIAEATVKALRQDAWVKLPVIEGTVMPCKLVAIIPATETYIFANRAGLKVAEYTASQLAHMIVTENSEILDTGAEFESAMANIVSGLREDKNKSYDELTGDSA